MIPDYELKIRKMHLRIINILGNLYDYDYLPCSSPCQMKRALLSLVEHPQNKLRIFKVRISLHIKIWKVVM